MKTSRHTQIHSICKEREGEKYLCFCCEYAADCEIDQQLHEMKL